MILFSIKIALRSPLSLALAPLLGPQWAAKAAAGRKTLAANPLRIGATVPNFDLEATMGAFRWSGALQAPSKCDGRMGVQGRVRGKAKKTTSMSEGIEVLFKSLLLLRSRTRLCIA